MKLSQEIRMEVAKGDEKGMILLRLPTNEELNAFLFRRFARNDKGDLVNGIIDVRADFFDQLFVGTEDMVDDAGRPIVNETKDRIPSSWKSAIINREFEDFTISRKN